MQQHTTSQRYQRFISRKMIIIAVAAVLLPVALAFSISVGAVSISRIDVIRVLLGIETGTPNVKIIFNDRLPHAIAAILAGSGLAISGASMQAVLRNPLCSPFTLGISSAAAFGAALVVFLGDGNIVSMDNTLSNISLPRSSVAGGAFLSSLIATGIVLVLGRKHGIKAETMILIGVALTAFYGAGIMLLQYIANEQQLAAMIYWTFGDTQRATWPMLSIMGMIIPFLCFYFFAQSWNYNALALGEEAALGLGVPVHWIRNMTMFLASMITAILVASLGIIGFVGLVVPHLARLLIGSDYRFVLPLSLLLGALLLLVSDTFARIIFAPRLLPVSILTAFFGAPIFMILLLRRNNA